MRVNNSPSFKAQFKISEQTDMSFSYKALKKALTKPAQGGKDLLDFMAYIYSDEGKAQLNKLPKEDTVELLLFEEDYDDEAMLYPYFYYASESMPLDKRVDFECQHLEGHYSKTKDLKEIFIEWTNNIVDYLNQK
ncbi:MAG: hypothetical protein IJY61_01445 [Candidatus Gastranaerophilales bacterium]|nr:hypothetical protein [Candidatus Gastranaerophilales bacterium]